MCMARDWDFRTRPSGVKALSSKPHQNKPRKNVLHYLWIVALLLIGLIFIFIGVSQNDQPTGQASTSSFPAAPEVVPSAASSSTTSTAPTSTIQEVSLYDGGAGEEATKSLATTLEAKGYKVSNLGKSQFEYVGITVWYASGKLDAASSLAALLPNRPTLKESQLGAASGFTLLIYLGR